MEPDAHLAAGPVLRINRGQQTAFLDDRPLALTGTEYRLLACLAAAPGRTFTRDELMATAIAGGAVVVARAIDQHIYGLRRKLRPLRVIHTVRGVGYCYEEPPRTTAQP
jgi:DNA-binding response OmpR family regulator